MRYQRVAILVFVATGMLACGVKQEIYDAKALEAKKLAEQLGACEDGSAKLNEELEAMKVQNASYEKRLLELGEDLTKLQGEKGALATDLKETQERERKLRAEQEAQKARMAKYRKVIEKFQALVTSGKLKIRIVRGRMVVEMSSNILFPSGKDQLLDDGKKALEELAAILKTITDRDLQVAGHTDNVPIRSNKFKSNWELSTARAVTVVKFLQDQGVKPTLLSAAGYSEYQPAASNDTEEGKANNRRIEVILMPNLDELPDLSGLGLNKK